MPALVPDYESLPSPPLNNCNLCTNGKKTVASEFPFFTGELKEPRLEIFRCNRIEVDRVHLPDLCYLGDNEVHVDYCEFHILFGDATGVYF